MPKKTIDENTFTMVKALTRGGSSVKEIANYLDISPATIYRIREAKTLDEYRGIVNAPARTPAPASVPAPVASAYVNNRMYELLKEQNELLKLISNKLAYVVEQLS